MIIATNKIDRRESQSIATNKINHARGNIIATNKISYCYNIYRTEGKKKLSEGNNIATRGGILLLRTKYIVQAEGNIATNKNHEGQRYCYKINHMRGNIYAMNCAEGSAFATNKKFA